MAELLIEKYLDEGNSFLEEKCQKDIEKNRKGNFTVILKDSQGNPIKNKAVHFRHKTHDFDFGCNFFMYRQYDTKEENLRYEEKWKKLFNTAVVPLYWEGTEPEKNTLRYTADSENNIYRRPPAESVVNWGKENGVRLKGHPLFWHEFIPQWLPESWEELYPLIEKRFREISTHFAKDIPVFDCVNEPMRVWNVHKEHLKDCWKHIVPPDNYLEQMFSLAKEYFPENELILNEATTGSFVELHGKYGGYYQIIKDLLSKGVKPHRIGLQCHTSNSPAMKNIFSAKTLYEIFDIYSDFDVPLVLSEISVASVFDGIKNEELQAKAARELYTVCFAHKNVSGLFWWNLTDDGILATKRKAEGENLPSTGLIDGDYNEKQAYKEIDRLINQEWRTDVTLVTDQKGEVNFRGFIGVYEVMCDGKISTLHLGQTGNFIL